MTIEVTAPDGSIVEFPDGMDPKDIDSAMRQHFMQSPADRFATDFGAYPQGGQGSLADWNNRQANQAAIAANQRAQEGAINRGDIVTPGAGTLPMALATSPMTVPAVAGRAATIGAAAVAAKAAQEFDLPDWGKELLKDIALSLSFRASGNK